MNSFERKLCWSAPSLTTLAAGRVATSSEVVSYLLFHERPRPEDLQPEEGSPSGGLSGNCGSVDYKSSPGMIVIIVIADLVRLE